MLEFIKVLIITIATGIRCKESHEQREKEN